MSELEKKQRLLSQANRVLTNYFSGEMNKLQSSITDRMQFTIENGSTSEKIAVAVATGNIDTEGFEFDATEGSVTKHNHNNAGLLAAGYAADVVLDDGVVTVGEDHNSFAVTMSTAAGKTINHCKRYLEHNPRCVKRVTIAATSNSDGRENPAAFNASMFLASLNPFQKEAAREVDMSQYFQTNQFQSGKIVIDYNYGDLQWNDLLYWAIEVETSTTLKVTIDFYPPED
ncbi:MAG: hypothetical protein IKN11_07720 [Bacteroidales bacterium]|nr:hypothetical protein [Bacteroidales bacterium]